MRKLFFCILFIAVASCTEDSTEVKNEDFVALSIPDIYQFKASQNYASGKSLSTKMHIEVLSVKVIKEDGQEVMGKIRFTIPDDDSFTLANLEMTSNLLKVDGLDKEMLTDYYGTQTGKQNLSLASKGGCFQECRAIAQGEGRGICKAECWFNIVVKLAPLLLLL
jgi:hypothetical protein